MVATNIYANILLRLMKNIILLYLLMFTKMELLYQNPISFTSQIFPRQIKMKNTLSLMKDIAIIQEA